MREDGDYAETVAQKKKKKKKVVYAKEAKWRDIPDWEGKTDCPLFQMPTEVLDQCFEIQDGLGVSVFFSKRLTCA